ncbi:hypothetical protein L0337_18155 [candidate division KSB1 bacterium]|nr:hypothetical protein [candidate division KSB1 bacterium]
MKTISAEENFDRQISQTKFCDSLWRKKLPKWLLVLVLFLLIAVIYGNAKAGDWSYSGSVQYAYGNYIFTTKTQSYYVLSHLRYRTERYRPSLGLPVIAQNSSLVAFGSGGMMPRRRTAANDDMGRNHEAEWASFRKAMQANSTSDSATFFSTLSTLCSTKSD